jgi:hypothetical protein
MVAATSRRLGLIVLGLPAASTGEGWTRSTRKARLTSLRVREEGGSLGGGAGNDDYGVQKVPRWPARSRGGGRGERCRGATQTRAWWLSAHGGFGSMARKVDHSTVLGDPTQSCKVDGEAVRAPTRCRPEAARHTVDDGAD